MIDLILTSYAREMEQFLSSFFHQPEGLVEVGPIGLAGSEAQGKLVITLLTVERETTLGIASGKGQSQGGISGFTHPPVYINLNVIIAAVFSEKRYKESLSVLSQAICFFQTSPVFTTADGGSYTIELMTPSLQDQNNIWTAFGGHYYPSVMCKIRRLTFDANEVKRTLIGIKGADTNIK